MPIYQILGRKAQLVSFPDGDDKVLPSRTVFQANSRNVSVKRLLRMKPPACRELRGDEIPVEFRPQDILVVLDDE